MHPIKVCIRLRTGVQWMGGVYYTQNLVRAIDSLPSQQRERIRLTIALSTSELKQIEPIRQHVDHIDAMRINDWYLFLASRFLCRKLPALSPHCFNYKRFDFVYPDQATGRLPYLWGGWIPDFQHRHLPDFFSKDEIAMREKRYSKIASLAPVIILSSQMAQDDFSHFYPEAAHRSRVMSFTSYAADEWFDLDPVRVQKKYKLPDKFFLVSNQLWMHKNHQLVVDALALLKQSQIEPVVVCTGSTEDPRHPEYFANLQTQIAHQDLSSQVFILGLIPRLDQVQLMRRCLAVIQPSLFEGWSSLVEDVRSIGRPIYLSDFPVHIEQNPPHSMFFDRMNAEQLASLLADGWETLGPGPDLDAEDKARADNQARIVAYGQKFLEIAQHTIQATK